MGPKTKVINFFKNCNFQKLIFLNSVHNDWIWKYLQNEVSQIISNNFRKRIKKCNSKIKL